MIKKLLLLVIIVGVVFPVNPKFIKAQEPVTNNIVNNANNWLLTNGLIIENYFCEVNDNNRKLNNEYYITGTRETIVYGDPHGNTVIINGGARSRYLGYTMSDANFTNYMYPDDTSGATTYYKRGYNNTNLVKDPWRNPKTRTHFAVINSKGIQADRQFCGKPEFEPYIREGLRIRSRDEMSRQGIKVDYPTVDFTREQIESINWYEYTYIIQPPTDYSWGSGVLFRDNGAGYLTVPIPPNPYNPDLPTPTATPIPIPEPEVFEEKETSDANCELYSNKYDVKQGIPTKENLYVKIKANNFVIDLNAIERTGRKECTITVNRTYTFNDGESIKVSVPYTAEKGYSYYEINNAGVYGIQKAVIQKPETQKEWMLPQSVTIEPSSDYKKPDVELWHSSDMKDHIDEPKEFTLPEKIVSDDSLKSIVKENVWPTEGDAYEARQAVNNMGIEVKNDKLIVKEYTKDGAKKHIILNNNWSESNSDNPNAIEAEDIADYELSHKKDDLVITPQASNGDYSSICDIYYEFIDGVNNDIEIVNEEINLNSVTVHAPVVCDPAINNDKPHNQEITPDDKRAAMILGRTSSLTFPTNGNKGKASNIVKKGYDGADYSKYILNRTIKFPFDIYINDMFYPKNTVYVIDNSEIKTLKLDMPTWVDEGNYDVECKTYAINSSDIKKGEESLVNKDYNYYVAAKNIPVRVIGRVFGFKLTDINDYPDWVEVFRIDKNSSKHSENYYWVGDLNEEGQARGNADKFTLPVLNGSHTSKSNLGVLKTGYKIKFDLTTIGNYFSDGDCVRIKPKFYYVKKDGSSRQEVDLWYTEEANGANSLIKVGSKTDANNIKSIVLGDSYRNVPDEELADTSEILGMTKNEFANQKAKIGAYGEVILSKNVRTFVGDTSNIPGVNEDRVKESIQKWYGEYSLPNNVYVCKKGFNVASSMEKTGFTGKEGFWFRNGYIIVNFEIQTLKNLDISKPQLSYWNNPNCDMWKMEGFNYTKKDSSGALFQLNDGDMIFYYTDKKSSDDYSSGGIN